VTDLTPEYVQDGAAFLRALDAAGIPVTAACWYLADDETGWQLLLASPEVAQTGALKFVKKIFAHLDALGDMELTANHVTVLRPEEHPVPALCKALHTVPGIQKIRFTRSAANGVMIPDALIYRLP